MRGKLVSGWCLLQCLVKTDHGIHAFNWCNMVTLAQLHQLTWGHSPPERALRLISSTVFFLESWSDRETNTGLMYLIKAWSRRKTVEEIQIEITWEAIAANNKYFYFCNKYPNRKCRTVKHQKHKRFITQNNLIGQRYNLLQAQNSIKSLKFLTQRKNRIQ